MANQLDYYAGYPNQQKTPKWVGVAIGSVFGFLTLMMLAIGIRVVMPSRAAEASRATEPPQAVAAAPTPIADEQAAVVAADDDLAPRPIAKAERSSRHGKSKSKSKMKKGGRGMRVASAKAAPMPKAYKKAQVYAKSVSGGRRDKRARDELDRMLGL